MNTAPALSFRVFLSTHTYPLKLLRATFVSLLASAPLTCYSAEVSVVCADIPRPVLLEVPPGFTQADTAAARSRRGRLLDFYRLNPSYKGRYEDVLVRDWLVNNPMPQLIVSTLGAVRGAQGSISDDDWNVIRKEALNNSSSQQIAEIRAQFRPAIEAGSPVPLTTSDELLWLQHQDDPASVVVLARMSADIDGQRRNVLSARKILYHQGYLVTVDIVLDARRPGALSELQDLVRMTKVSRI